MMDEEKEGEEKKEPEQALQRLKGARGYGVDQEQSR